MSYGRHACLPSASLLAVFFVVSVSWRRRRQQQQQQRRWSPVTRSVGRRQTSRLAPASGRSAVQSGGYYGEWEREGGHWFPLWVIQPWVESLARCPACPHEYCADRPQSRLLLICIDGGPSGQRPWYRVGVRSGPWLQAERRRRGVLARPAKRCARRDTTGRGLVSSTDGESLASPPVGLRRKMTDDRYTSCHSLLSLSLTIDLHFFIFALPSAIAVPLFAGRLQGHWACQNTTPCQKVS